jgi:hypothetical protein
MTNRADSNLHFRWRLSPSPTPLKKLYPRNRTALGSYLKSSKETSFRQDPSVSILLEAPSMGS